MGDPAGAHVSQLAAELLYAGHIGTVLQHSGIKMFLFQKLTLSISIDDKDENVEPAH